VYAARAGLAGLLTGVLVLAAGLLVTAALTAPFFLAWRHQLNEAAYADGLHGTMTVRHTERRDGTWHTTGPFLSDDGRYGLAEVAAELPERPGELVAGWVRRDGEPLLRTTVDHDRGPWEATWRWCTLAILSAGSVAAATLAVREATATTGAVRADRSSGDAGVAGGQ
jgi:hypothetical protein